MKGATAVLQRKCACGKESKDGASCAKCSAKEKGVLQRYSDNSAPTNEIAPSIVHDALRSPGSPLDPNIQTFMESRFAYDFSSVRVHSGGIAAESARAVNSHAYTVGHDIVFGQRQYDPHTSTGQKLLAHELTHVVQQQNQPQVVPKELRLGKAGDRFEQEADLISGMLDYTPAHNTLKPAGTTLLGGGLVSRLIRTNPFGTGPKSSSVPDLEEKTVQVANAAIKEGRFQDAITVILRDAASIGKVDLDLLDNLTMAFDPLLAEEGKTTDPQRDRSGKTLPARVQIGRLAFSFGVPWLYSTILHENIHVRQAQPIGSDPGIKVPKTAADPLSHAQEVEAYANEIMNAEVTGVKAKPNLIVDIWNRLRLHWIWLMPVIKRSLQDLVTRAHMAAQKIVGKQTVLTPP